MSVFGDYGRYYDLLYRDKNYCAEAEYVHNMVQEYVPDAKSLLELGCGTGRYSSEFVRLGYEVTGIDLSETMLAEARNRADGADFLCGDVRSMRLERKFDAIISLFHVMSYQVENKDVLDTLITIKDHLQPNGVACFDFWYGPAVLSQRPDVRLKEVEDEETRIARVAVPELLGRSNTVNVLYKFFCRNKKTDCVTEFQESHLMRYFFEQEWDLFCRQAGLKPLIMEEALSRKTPNLQTWSVTLLMQLDAACV